MALLSSGVGMDSARVLERTSHRRPARLLAALALLLSFSCAFDAKAGGPPLPQVQLVGPPQILFDPAKDGCDGNDVPDAPARLFRGADGGITLFGLHYTNHPLQGRSLDTLKISCRSALPSPGNGDPAAFADKNWIASTWTRDGHTVDGLVHHEFQADSHAGRCRFSTYMQCWFNTVLAVRSTDGGATFAKLPQPVVASAPFPQDVEQGRHRGFFNPSNIASDGRFSYVLISTTGWAGQEAGVCLFRTANPDDPGSWRAFDGTAFSIRYADPYRPGALPKPAPCRTVAPFPAPVGGIVRQRGTGLWIAVFQAAKDGGHFPVSGFYTATSRDLLNWSEPRLLLPGTTNYEDPCASSGRLLAYPVLVDPQAVGRNFDDIGTEAELLYSSSRVDGCTITADRKLVRQRVSVGAKT